MINRTRKQANKGRKKLAKIRRVKKAVTNKIIDQCHRWKKLRSRIYLLNKNQQVNIHRVLSKNLLNQG